MLEMNTERKKEMVLMADNLEQEINNYFSEVVNTIQQLDKEAISKFVDLIIDAYDNERTILVFGNGGSGANASHFCGDLVKDMSYGLKKRFKAICLNDNTPCLMAVANDICYEDIFVEPLKNFVRKGDLVIGISGSGNSENVVRALKYANSEGAETVAICGFTGGKIKDIANLSVHATVDNMEISEDLHLLLFHCVKTLLMKRLKGIAA